MSFVRVVNMIPFNQSGETNQDSEPNLAVNPQRPTDMVGTAFTTAPALPGGGVSPFAPIYVSTDGGENWSLRNVLPGGALDERCHRRLRDAGGSAVRRDLESGHDQHVHPANAAFASNTPMAAVLAHSLEDQPWVVAGSVVVNGRSVDRVYVGSRAGAPAAIEVSQDAATTPAPAGFTETDPRPPPRSVQSAADANRDSSRRHGVCRLHALHEHIRGRQQLRLRCRRAARRQLGQRGEPVHRARRAGVEDAGRARLRVAVRAVQRHRWAGAHRGRSCHRGPPGRLVDGLHRMVRSSRWSHRHRLAHQRGSLRPTVVPPGDSSTRSARSRKTRRWRSTARVAVDLPISSSPAAIG